MWFVCKERGDKHATGTAAKTTWTGSPIKGEKLIRPVGGTTWINCDDGGGSIGTPKRNWKGSAERERTV